MGDFSYRQLTDSIYKRCLLAIEKKGWPPKTVASLHNVKHEELQKRMLAEGKEDYSERNRQTYPEYYDVSKCK